MSHRLFIAGIVLMVLFGVGHFLGFIQARRAARHDPALAEATGAMRAVTARLGGMTASLLDYREYFSAAFTPMMIGLAGVSLIACRLAADPARAVRVVSIADCVVIAVLLALSVVYGVFQGVVSCGVILALFIGAALTA